MDLNSMKRRDLQALCKKHGLPANASNCQMIDSLSSILQEKMKPKGCLKGSGDSAEDLGIFRGGSKKVTFVLQDEGAEGDKESWMNPVGKSKRKSIRRRSSIAPELDKGGGETEKGSHCESPKNVDEVPRRATRSRGLAESVLWSPVIEKKRTGTEGVRQNAKPSMGKEEKANIAEVPLSRSLRNRVVVVGGDEDLLTDKYTRNTQKRKNNDKNEHKENAAASLEEDEAVGKQNLRKRSREGVAVEDEPPPQRTTRSHAKFEETVATEEVDIGRPMKRRKGGMEVLPIVVVVGKEIERGLKSGGSTKRSRGNTLDYDAMESGDVTGPPRRSTRSTSAPSEAGQTVSAVGKLDHKGKAVGENRSVNQANGGDSGSLMADSEVVAGHVRRSTRSSSTLMEDASLLVGRKSIKGKSQEQLTRLSASVVVAEHVRRSTRSSSALQEEKTCTISVGESGDGAEVVGKSRSQKQTKEHGLKNGDSKISLPSVAAVPEHIRRSTRQLSNLEEDGISLPVVRKSIRGGKAVKNGKSQKHANDHGLTGGGSTSSLVDNEVIVEPARRSTRSASSLFEGRTSPVVGKSVKESNAAMKGRPRKQRKNHASEGEVSLASLSDSEAICEPAKRPTRSSSKMSEDESNSLAVGKSGGADKAIRNNKSGKYKRDRSIERGGSAASLPDSRVVITPTRRSTRGHSDAVRKDNSSKKPKAHIIEQGDSTTALLDEAVTTPERRSTCRSSKVPVPADGEVLRSPCSLYLDKDAVSSVANRLTRQSSKIRAGSEVLKSPFSSHPDNEASLTSSRRSSHHSSKLPADSEILKSPCSLRLDDEAVTTPARRSTRHSSKVLAESEVLKSPCSSHPDKEASITPDRRLTLHSLKVPADSDVPRSPYASHPDDQSAIMPATRLTRHVSEEPADSEVMKSPCSLHTASSLLEDIKEDAHVKAKSLWKEQAYVQEGHIDMKRTFIEGTDLAGQSSIPGPLATSLSEVSHDVDPKTASQMRQSPESIPLEKIEYDSSLVGTLNDLDDMSLSSHIIEGQSSSMDVANNCRGESPLNIVEGSSEVQEEFSGKLACSNVDATTEAGPLEPYGDDGDATAAPVEAASSIIGNKKAVVGALDMDGLASTESQNIISLPVPPISSEEQSTAFHTEISTMAYFKVPDSTREVDPDHEDILTMHVTAPRSPCKSSDELMLTSNAEASLVFASKEPTLDLEICGASEVGLQYNEATYSGRPALVGKMSEELLCASASPETEPELKLEAECPSADVSAVSRVDKILATSNIEVCSEICCDINNEESDSKVEVHIGNKGHMEGTEAANIAGSPLFCNSAGALSPTFLPTLHNEISPDIDIREPDLSVHAQVMSNVASDIRVSLVETSGIHSKTLEVSVTAERDAESLSNNKGSFEVEVENCKVDPDFILTGQLAPEECDAGKKIEASVTGRESQSWIGVDLIKETWISSTSSVIVNGGAETEGDKSGAEKDGDEVMPSSPRENPTCDLDSGDHMKEGGSPSSTAQLTPVESDEKNGDEVMPSSPRENPTCDLDSGDHMKEGGSPSSTDQLTTVESDEKNGDEVMPSSPSENPTCDLDIGDHMKEGGSPSSTAQLAPEESDAGKKIEVSISGSEPRSSIGVEVIKETWVSSTLSVTFNDGAETECDKSGAEKNGDELMPSSSSENPTCDLYSGDHMKEGGSPSSTAQLAPEECDVGKKVEASIAGSELQSCVDVEVIRETRVSSTSAVTVNDDTETEGDTSSSAENNGDDRMSSSPSEYPVGYLDTGVHMKEQGTSLSTEDAVDDTSTLDSHGNSKKSDLTLSLYDKDQADAEGNLRDSSADKFCEDSSKDFRSLDTFIIPDGPSYVLPVASEDGESAPSQIAAASSKFLEGKSSIDHGSFIQTPASSGKLVKQLEKEDELRVLNVGPTEISALTTENRSPTDAVLFGGDTKAGDLPIFHVAVTCDEDILPITTCETHATLGYKGSVKKGDTLEFPCVPDSEAAKMLSDGKEVALSVKESLGVHFVDRSPKLTFKEHEALEQRNEVSEAAKMLSDGKEVALSVKESLGVHFVDRSPKLTFKEHEALEQRNEVANIIPETVHIANEHAGVEHERLELAAIVAEEMENIESLERNASIKGEDDTVVKKPDSIGRSTLYHFGEVCEKQDEDFLFQSGELHHGDVATYSTLDNSASTRGDERVSSLENFASATDMENVPSLPKMDLVLSDKDQLTKCNTEKASAEKETLNMKEFPCSASSVPLADQKESPDTLGCFEHVSNVEEEGVAHGAMPMPAEDLVCMDSEVANFANDCAQVGHGKCVDFLRINIAGSIAIEDGEMKDVVSSGSSDAKDEETCPYNCEISPIAENLSGSSAKPCAGMDAQDIHFADQPDDQEGRRNCIQESLEVPKLREEEIFTVLDVTKIEGSPTGMSQIEKCESTLMRTIATQEELAARKCSELSVTTVDDQVVFWDCKESSAMESGPIGNELEDPEFRVTCTAQHEVASLDTGAFGVNSEATHESMVNKNEIIECEDCFEDFSGINTARSLAMGEGAMKAIPLLGSYDANSEEVSPDDCPPPPKADNLPGGSAKHSARLDSQDQSEDNEEMRSLQETSEISKFSKEKTVMKIEGSPTVMFKSEKIEVASMPTFAKQGELIARNHTDLHVTNVADQVQWNYSESSDMDMRHIGNELGDPEFRGACNAQHALAPLDAGDVGVGRAATRDSSIVDKDETMAPEDYYEDFCWPFPDTGDVDSSQHEARVVDSQLAMESTLDKAGHSSKSGNDVHEEQNRSMDLKQTEDSNEGVQSTPMQLTRNFEHYSVVDDAIRNKENTVGLKMGSTQKHNEKSTMSTSSRRPLQSVLRTKSEH